MLSVATLLCVALLRSLAAGSCCLCLFTCLGRRAVSLGVGYIGLGHMHDGGACG
jgi:hypothetical protein